MELDAPVEHVDEEQLAAVGIGYLHSHKLMGRTKDVLEVLAAPVCRLHIGPAGASDQYGPMMIDHMPVGTAAFHLQQRQLAWRQLTSFLAVGGVAAGAVMTDPGYRCFVRHSEQPRMGS